MTPKQAFRRWLVLGAIVALALIVTQAQATGGLAGTLQVGEDSALRPMIESELGGIPLAPGPGHDGQIFYAIALDLSGDEVGPLLDHAGYRYRRILYPLISSVFGILNGRALLISMVLVAIASMSLASGLAAHIGRTLGLPNWVGLAVMLNPGMWLSVRLLTSDVMAVALMLGGLFALLKARRSESAFHALSVLAKDVFLLVPVALAFGRGLRRKLVAAGAMLPLVLWMAIVTLTVGDGFSSRSNLGVPFQGFLDSSANWPNLDGEGLFYLGFALLSVALGIYSTLFTKGWLRAPIGAFTAVALLSSNWVWDLGNNAARAFAPILILVVLNYRREMPSLESVFNRDSDPGSSV